MFVRIMYYRTYSLHTELRCLAVLEINEHFLLRYRTYLSSMPPGLNGNGLFLPPGAVLPALPAPAVYPPYHPPYAPNMASLPPPNLQPEILANAEYNQENAHAEPGQPSNFNHLHNQQLMLPDSQYYPRNVLPPAEFREYLPVYRAGYPEIVFDNANYNVDQRELPPEPRPDFRRDSNYVPVNRDPWQPVNETFFDGVTNVMEPFANNTENAFFDGVTNVMEPFANNTEDMFGVGDRRVVGADRLANPDRNSSCLADEELEEELEALARRIDTEFKSAD
ncbi:uncharacterized protein LOC134754075 isoform X2 [Cydia strobilella]|uniref:uncharacterized protein LOC134754075 isoform X2 n=1 Tax=Cydia strobilella TaxID=1100964 RepID=UPI0030050E1B